ncbi:gluconate 2-dehydrogenase subunit 3 family protein [Dyella telluris]|uniref:Gluconate 2-dehydrogenase subunit 3 family protein n=1 Tax=Dyella telluris TaxID=2763498 RepID=A0A7G8Q8S7_9GAMM|nr:gluconate 2-dehydrogenase subunit 3 family protein [Dyella telluris]QNK03185.1 gluconate 2-dehydrogenase subunit 3 family protein [Dyella telluris]
MSSKPSSPSRRDFLRQSLVAVPAVSLLGTSAIAQTQSGSAAAPAAMSAGNYAPRYFTAPEWAFLQAAVDRLIPSNDDGPGAVEAGVPEFLDRQMEAAYGHGGLWYMQGPFVPESPPTLGYQLRYTPREFYRKGIAAIDDWCRKQHQKTFAELPADQRDAILHQLEKGEIHLDDVPTAAFFTQLLTNTKEGYFADPMYGGNKQMAAWKMIGFPGARADFADWIEQPGKVYPYGPVSIEGAKS